MDNDIARSQFREKRVDSGRKAYEKLFVPQLEYGRAELARRALICGRTRFDWDLPILSKPQVPSCECFDVDDTMVTLRWKNLDVEIIDFEDGSAVRIVFHDGNDDVPESALLTRQDVYDIADVTRVVNQINPTLDQYPYSGR